MVLFGIAGCFIGMAFSYFNGTITTLEKRYKIPTKTSGIITVGNDISTTLSCAFLGYYAGRGHRPKYVALGKSLIPCFSLSSNLPLYVILFLFSLPIHRSVFSFLSFSMILSPPSSFTLYLYVFVHFLLHDSFSSNFLFLFQGLLILAIFCLLMASPHFIYGAGEDAIKLTHEYLNTSVFNATQEDPTLCQSRLPDCVQTASQWAPIILLFVAQFISGIGCSLFYTLGLSYMDDNSTKSKSPAMLSKFPNLFLLSLSSLFSLFHRLVCFSAHVGSSVWLLLGIRLPTFLHRSAAEAAYQQ